MAERRKRRLALYTIPSDLSFVDALVSGLLSGRVVSIDPDDPLALSRVQILLPTRRACRALSAAFLRQAPGNAMLLPRIRPLGDLDDDEPSLGDESDAGDGGAPAISPLRRQLLLTRLVLQLGTIRGETGETADQAARLARALAHLLDEIQTERVDPQALATLVPERYAAHWQRIVRFLTLITEHWPRILADERALDPAARRDRVLSSLAARWRTAPPAHPVVAAGSTGTIPGTADLLATVAAMPGGCVVLPGLDTEADEASWRAVGPTHPQFGLRRLLERLGATRAAVAPWPVPPRNAHKRARLRLLREAMRPAETTDAWRKLDRFDPHALATVRRVDCASPQEEAGVIALIMRLQLERAGRTAALVTADRALARRVAAELRRWRIEVDDSAGTPLGRTRPGTFLRLTARLAAERLAPVSLLAALKHPLAAGGIDRVDFVNTVRAIEVEVLRGPRPAPGTHGLRAAVSAACDQAAAGWLDRFARALAPFEAALAKPRGALGDLVAAHIAFAEWLAGDDRTAGTERLWAGPAGEEAATFVAELADAAGALPQMTADAYPALLDALMEGRVVRPPFGQHPRLFIWGTLEARLQHADCMVLGGLNEGGWPPEIEGDPWLSRPMRASLGLPSPDRRIGLSAHDFVQCCGADEVVLTRARRIEGTPTVPSRWLARLDAVLDKLTSDPVKALRTRGEPLLDWWARLDQLPGAAKPVSPPAPRPPVSARPRSLSVTRIEVWIADPYAIYARHILGLKPLDPIDADPTAAERGIAIHQVMDAFVRTYRDALPDDAEDVLIALGRKAFAIGGARPGVLAFWWPRFERIARWFVATARARKGEATPIATEVAGALSLDARAGPFRLTAKADRLDRLADGRLVVIDYKTGAPPKQALVESGRRPQLPLEALIAARGGFEDVAAGEIAALEYWALTGAEQPGEIRPIGGDPHRLIATAEAGLKRLVARFDDPATPYLPVPYPDLALPWNDYAHLARIKEWSHADDGEGAR